MHRDVQDLILQTSGLNCESRENTFWLSKKTEGIIRSSVHEGLDACKTQLNFDPSPTPNAGFSMNEFCHKWEQMTRVI